MIHISEAKLRSMLPVGDQDSFLKFLKGNCLPFPAYCKAQSGIGQWTEPGHSPRFKGPGFRNALLSWHLAWCLGYGYCSEKDTMTKAAYKRNLIGACYDFKSESMIIAGAAAGLRTDPACQGPTLKVQVLKF